MPHSTKLIDPSTLFNIDPLSYMFMLRISNRRFSLNPLVCPVALIVVIYAVY
jgi:hypothetical protein